MTQDEQEAHSFRYVAPRIFILSSGNIAICPMLGRKPPVIVSPHEFAISCMTLIPTMESLEAQHRASEDDQRARALSLKPTRSVASLDDLV